MRSTIGDRLQFILDEHSHPMRLGWIYEVWIQYWRGRPPTQHTMMRLGAESDAVDFDTETRTLRGRSLRSEVACSHPCRYYRLDS